jgi:hypothetical protein
LSTNFLAERPAKSYTPKSRSLSWAIRRPDCTAAQKLVPTLEAAHERIYQHSLKLEDARAQAVYGQHSSVGKVLEIHQELPGRIHIVLIRQSVGF